MVSLGVAAITQVHLGRPDKALERSREARVLAEKLAHPFTLDIALGLSTFFHILRRDSKTALDSADDAIRVATEHGFQQLLGLGVALRGCALIEMHQPAEGVAQSRQGLARWGVSGEGLGQTAVLACLGDGYGRLGRAEEGLAAVAEGLAASERTGERMSDAELFRRCWESRARRPSEGKEGPTTRIQWRDRGPDLCVCPHFPSHITRSALEKWPHGSSCRSGLDTPRRIPRVPAVGL
jgi:hypothetical protein